MKKMLAVLLLMVVATVGSFAQAKSLDVIERQIKNASAELDRSEKKFEIEKSRKISDLKKEAKKQTTLGLRADDSKGRDNAIAVLKKLNNQIDSIAKVTVKNDSEIQAQTKQLYELQQQKTLSTAQLTAQSKPTKLNISAKDSTSTAPVAAPAIAKNPNTDPYNRSIPTRLTKLDRNQRSRSHNVRVDEALISRIENNANVKMSPAGEPGGYKVIFDNMYNQPVNFIARSINGAAKVAVMVDPGVMRTKYLLPGKYLVEIYINGRMSGEPRLMTIDGQECDYKGNLCYNYAFAPKFR